MLEKISLEEVNHLSKEEFVERFSKLFQDGHWIAEEAWKKRPFDSLYELRGAFQDVLFGAPPGRQLELMRSYPYLGGMARTDEASADIGLTPEEYEALATAAVGGVASPLSFRDQASVGLNRLSSNEYEALMRINMTYQEKFGFPLIIAVRERNTKEEILEVGEARLKNPPAQETATAIVEIAKIANFRLLDLVEEPLEEPVAAERS
jgi:uric acid transporter